MKTAYNLFFISLVVLITCSSVQAQSISDSSLLSIDRIYSNEFKRGFYRAIRWIENGEAYLTTEKSISLENSFEFIRYESSSQERSVFIPAKELIPTGDTVSISIQNFTLSPDETKVLIFTNSSRVWRSYTKGDYWVYDLSTNKLQQLGEKFESSSLMFAKFSPNNKYVAYVQGFNLYKEEFATGKVTQLTFDGNRDIINGTFDWVYEEEFGCRDGFRWGPDGKQIAFWQLDASEIGTYYMINNTDSVYSKLIPLQYPKVGQEPSACKVGVILLASGEIAWVDLPGGEKENYVPAIQWINADFLMIQQLNRKQNELNIWKYIPSSGKLTKIYTEKEETWVDLNYPDFSSNSWGKNDLILTDNSSAFLRMTENDGWRHVYKINMNTGKKKLVTRGKYDVASVSIATSDKLFFIASPENSTQRYLYSIGINGKGNLKRITPENYKGANLYNNFAPNGKYAIHTYNTAQSIRTVYLINLPDHKIIKTLVDNKDFKLQMAKLKFPEISFFKVTTEEGIELDGRMIKPINFDSNKKYPVLFHVYGEPWVQTAIDSWVGIWNIMLAQQGFVIIDMDNRGTPCLKGSEWRKCVYRKVGVINTRDQDLAAKEVLKWNFIDKERTAVWGWSGGGTMTLNLMFKYPEIYKTGMCVAGIAHQLNYDNIYQERYMGLPEENMQDYIDGSPITYAKNLDGNLLIVHGTADDNCHYQNAEMIANELIKYNKQFQIMPYPNRSHGIHEGVNTRRHLYTLLTNYLIEHTAVK